MRVPLTVQRDGRTEHRERRQAARQLGGDEKNRQQIDEPQRAERLDEGFQIQEADAAPAEVRGEAGRLESVLDRHPQPIEIGEVNHLAIEISAPVAVDDDCQKQPGDQEEIRHPERLREGHEGMHEADLAGRGFDAQHRMHHHHHDDADAFGVIHPVDALRGAR